MEVSIEEAVKDLALLKTYLSSNSEKEDIIFICMAEACFVDKPIFEVVEYLYERLPEQWVNDGARFLLNVDKKRGCDTSMQDLWFFAERCRNIDKKLGRSPVVKRFSQYNWESAITRKVILSLRSFPDSKELIAGSGVYFVRDPPNLSEKLKFLEERGDSPGDIA
jgi:hypothetical protein